MKLLSLLFAAGLWCGAQGADAASSQSGYCDRPAPMSARQEDRLLRFAALIKQELDRSGQTVALIARSGVDLSRFGVRYSHAGVIVKASDGAPWSVRQLYYACDEQRPRLYDQGLSGFLFGTDDPTVGYVSIVVPKGTEAATLERAALDNALALRLLAGTYSANAYPFSLTTRTATSGWRSCSPRRGARWTTPRTCASEPSVGWKAAATSRRPSMSAHG